MDKFLCCLGLLLSTLIGLGACWTSCARMRSAKAERTLLEMALFVGSTFETACKKWEASIRFMILDKPSLKLCASRFWLSPRTTCFTVIFSELPVLVAESVLPAFHRDRSLIHSITSWLTEAKLSPSKRLISPAISVSSAMVWMLQLVVSKVLCVEDNQNSHNSIELKVNKKSRQTKWICSRPWCKLIP